MKMVLFGFLVMVAALVAMSSGCAALQEVGLDDGRRAIEMPEDMAPVPVAVAWWLDVDWTPELMAMASGRCKKDSRESCTMEGWVYSEGVADDVDGFVVHQRQAKHTLDAWSGTSAHTGQIRQSKASSFGLGVT